MSENRVLRRIFGPKSDQVTGGWRKPYNMELHNLYTQPSIIRIIKSKGMSAEHIARVREKRKYDICWKIRRNWYGSG
jgi:hypothetical protein